jgi:hypothetical protein
MNQPRIRNPSSHLAEEPLSSLERKFIKDYLRKKGHRLSDLVLLPKDKAKQLMTEASVYASLKLAEIESIARLRRDIRDHQ